MKLTVDYDYRQNFLPTKRHRKVRTRIMHGKIDVNIKELSETEFPVAFIVHDMKSVYEGMRSYEDYSKCKNDYKMFPEEIRTYKNKLWTPIRVTYGSAISTLFEDETYIMKNISRHFTKYLYDKEDFTEKSVVMNDDETEVEKSVKKYAKQFIHFDNKFYRECKEPMYVINTFGLGHNHGGTAMFIEYSYNPNISSDNYFNALQRDEAIKYGKSVALRRGDTEYVDRIGKFDNIEAVMPEMVKANPKKEHGKGSEFMNMMESVVSSSSNKNEAGLLCAAAAMAFTDIKEK